MNETQFHGIELKADYKNSRIALGSTEFQDLLENLVQASFDEYWKRGTGKAQNYTHQNHTDLEFFSKPEEPLFLDRVIFHGEYFSANEKSPKRILTQAAKFKFYPQRIDLKFDISSDFLPYSVIHEHFRDDKLTATAGYTPWTSPDGAKTWYVGTKQRNGFRASFYESAKIHTGMPEGAHRVEVQMFGAEAQKFTAQYLADPTDEFLSQYILYLLSKRVTFREPSSDTNRSRWAECRWWQDITRGAGAFSVHKAVARKVLDTNRVLRLYQTITSKFDTMGMDIFSEGLGQFLLSKPGVLSKIFTLYPMLNPSFGY